MQTVTNRFIHLPFLYQQPASPTIWAMRRYIAIKVKPYPWWLWAGEQFAHYMTRPYSMAMTSFPVNPEKAQQLTLRMAALGVK
jgi:hypothetical protein